MGFKDAFLRKMKHFTDETEARYAKKTDISAYSISRKAEAEEGYAASYVLMKDGAAAGDTVNIPKDYLVKSADVKACAQEGVPAEGLKPGDKYIDFTVNTVNGDGNESHMYIALKDIAPGYVSGNGIVIGTSNEIGVKISAEGANGLSADEDGLKMALATAETAGAMSAADKARLDSAVTEEDMELVTEEDIRNLFGTQQEQA